MLMLRWLLRVFCFGAKCAVTGFRPGVQLALSAQHESHKPLLKAMHDGVRSALNCFNIMHKNGIFLERSLCKELSGSIDLFCAAYSFLAAKCLGLKLCRFHLQPKLHVFRHMSVRLVMLLNESDSSHFMSPASFLCEQSEDFVGRISRIGRRAPARNVCLRTLQRYLIKVHFNWNTK